jgi:hypothetical protein
MIYSLAVQRISQLRSVHCALIHGWITSDIVGPFKGGAGTSRW